MVIHKRYIGILLAILTCSTTYQVVAKNIVLIPAVSASTMFVNGKLYTTEIYHDKINQLTYWSISDGGPPVSINDAYKIVAKKAATKFPSIDWYANEVTLTHTKEKKAFYRIELRNNNNEKDIVILYVLMNGETSDFKSGR